MGGKGSGRKKKSDEEILAEIRHLMDFIYSDVSFLHGRITTLMQRITYYPKTRCLKPIFLSNSRSRIKVPYLSLTNHLYFYLLRD